MNKIAIVTGGASGLGLEIAKSFSKQGIKTLIFDINDAAFKDIGSEFDCYKVDVTDESQIQKTIDNIVSKYETIDILVNSAGVIYSAPLINIFNPEAMQHSYKNFKKIMSVNLDSSFLMTKAVAEKMILKRTKGNIINISSISAQGNAGQTAYAASKAGVEAITKVWAKELGSLGIRVNAIAPGFIDTPSTSTALNEKLIQDIKARTPLNTLGSTNNISKAAVYLLENDFVNGEVLKVDGGLVL